MGGSGSGGYNPPPQQSPCATLTFKAIVNSPKADMLAGLTEGMRLRLIAAPNAHSVTVLNGQDAVGSITGNRVGRLIECMATGFEFVAVVDSMNGGQCAVIVKSA